MPRSYRIGDGAVVVVATIGRDIGEQILAFAARALGEVEQVWGRAAPRPVVVVAPRDREELAAVLHRRPGQVAGTAGWTLGPREPGQPAGADEVVLNPEVWREASDAGRAATLRHELTHVVVRAGTTAALPRWLDEGFAQHVAYDCRACEGIDPDALARPYLDHVRRDGLPAALPTDSAFDGSPAARQDAYLASWLAVREIARARGAGAVLAAVRSGRPEDSGWSVATITRRWQARLRDALAGASLTTAP